MSIEYHEISQLLQSLYNTITLMLLDVTYVTECDSLVLAY